MRIEVKSNFRGIPTGIVNTEATMIITAKLVAICLGVALVAFTTSTIVLAVQKSNLQDELEALKGSTTTTTTTTVTPTTASTSSQPATTPTTTTTVAAPSTTNALPETTTTAPEIVSQ